MNDILTKIKELLGERGWTIYKLAQKADIPYSSLNSLFSNNTMPTISTLDKICKGFQITIAEFFSENTPYRNEDDYTSDERELISSYRKLNRNHKKLLIDICHLMQ